MSPLLPTILRDEAKVFWIQTRLSCTFGVCTVVFGGWSHVLDLGLSCQSRCFTLHQITTLSQIDWKNEHNKHRQLLKTSETNLPENVFVLNFDFLVKSVSHQLTRRRQGSCSALSAVNIFLLLSSLIQSPRGLCLSVCLSVSLSVCSLCHFRVISLRCRNVQISSFAPQHIRQDYPQAVSGLSPRLSASSATVHQSDTQALHIWPQQLFQAFVQYHIQQHTLSITKPV